MSAEVQTTVERRKSARAPVTVHIAYGTVDALFQEFTRNINEGGVFIETEKPLGIDEKVQLQFRLPGAQEPIQASGRVAWIRPADVTAAQGMGIEFEDLDASARSQINELILQLRSR